MKNFNIFKPVFLLIISIVLITNSCKKDNSPAAPELPPQASFIVDFSDFSNGASANLTTSVTKSVEILTNYQTAAITVGYWSTVLYLRTAIPAACFKEAFKHHARYLGSSAWQRKYTLSIGTANISAKLESRLITDSVQWKMMISVTSDSLNVTDFIWFTGISSLDGTGGTWIVNESPSLPNPLFAINWSKRTNLLRSIQYTYVKPGEVATGNFIKFGSKDTTFQVTNVYDLYYILHSVNPVPFDFEIDWNSAGKNGRYQDINGWHCWGTAKQNINCN